MKYFKRAALTIGLSIFAYTLSHSQNKKSSVHVFSAVAGTESKPDTIKLDNQVESVSLTGSDTAQFKIISNQKGNLVVRFSPPNNITGIANAFIVLKNAADKHISSVPLTGLSTLGLEGKNEAPLSTIADALGYDINIGWKTLDNHALPQLMGEEIPFALFTKAGKGNVEIIPVARYSPDFKLPFGYYINSASAPQQNQVGILAAKNQYPQHQILFPEIVEGKTYFDPGTTSFGFYTTSPSHTAYSEDAWNMTLYPEHAVHATRIYPVKGKEGKLYPHTYLVCFEEAKNGDYNDYVFLVKNILPVKSSGFLSLFNGKDLSGWNTYLRDIGGDKDPNNNFQIRDGSLFVVGKDLGYLITKKGYKNFHFKVDFKWGERRWPPRDTAKRDAGICYNIPINSADSIWPQSIECQIQEGDVGDFWLLGFSTIKVDGIQNIPANHTRMVKRKDAEKPTGEWNTVEIISYNGKCVHIVNGVVVNVGEEASVKNGRILLQSEYSEVYYRNVKIREL